MSERETEGTQEESPDQVEDLELSEEDQKEIRGGGFRAGRPEKD